MLIVMKADATDAQVVHVCDVVTELGLKPHAMPGATRTAIGVTGNQGAVDPTRFENLPGVAEAIRVSKPYKLITLDIRPEKTVVRVGDATIGGDELAIIAGPCAIESHAQAFAVAEAVRRSGARFDMRARRFVGARIRGEGVTYQRSCRAAAAGPPQGGGGREVPAQSIVGAKRPKLCAVYP